MFPEPLSAAIAKFGDAVKQFEDIVTNTSESDHQNVQLINSRLVAIEKAFIHTDDHPILPDATGRR